MSQDPQLLSYGNASTDPEARYAFLGPLAVGVVLGAVGFQLLAVGAAVLELVPEPWRWLRTALFAAAGVSALGALLGLASAVVWRHVRLVLVIAMVTGVAGAFFGPVIYRPLMTVCRCG